MPSSSRQRFQEYLAEVKKKFREKRVPTKANPHASESSNPPDRNRSFFELLAAFWSLLKPYHSRIYLALATLSISTLLGLVPPLATKFAIDSCLTDPPLPLPDIAPAWMRSLSQWNLLLTISLAAAAITLLRTAIHLWGRWNATQSVNRLQASLRRDVFEHVLHMPLNRIYDIKSGGATSLLREDAGGVGDLIFSMLYNPWQAIVQLLGSFVILVIVDWRLLASAILLLPAVYYSHRTWIYRVRPLFRDIRSRRQSIDSATTETFGGIRIVRIFSRQKSESQRYVGNNHLMVRQQLMVWWRTRLIEIIWEVIIPLSSTGLLIYGGWQILEQQLTLGDLMMFLVYLAMLLGPIATLAGSAVQFQNNLAGLDRILDTLEEPAEMEDRHDARTVPAQLDRVDLRLNKVGFQYPNNDQWVLRNIDLEINDRQTVAFVGRSGAGKTTLCNLVARFFDPVEGQIQLNGVDLRDYSLQSYRKLLGVVEQDVFLFDGTIHENIAYGRRSATIDEVREAARAAAADEFITALPAGYESRIGERGIKLSGGQRQRLAIARAILSAPRILILDEATSNLDSESEQLIQQSISKLMRERTSLVIAHRLSTIQNADKIVVLEAGQVIEVGNHAELLQRNGIYASMIARQSTLAIQQAESK